MKVLPPSASGLLDAAPAAGCNAVVQSGLDVAKLMTLLGVSFLLSLYTFCMDTVNTATFILMKVAFKLMVFRVGCVFTVLFLLFLQK